MERPTAIILAGGKSSRMGQDKALLPVHGQPLLGHLCSILQPQAARILIVTSWPERYASVVPATVEWVQDVLDPDGQTQGPLMGFAQGLACVHTDWAMAVACDLPYLKQAAIARWCLWLPRQPASTLACLPKPYGWWEPLCGFYRRQSLASLRAFTAAGGRSFQRWLATLAVASLPTDDPQILFNLNTPADWQLVRQGLEDAAAANLARPAPGGGQH